MSSTEQEFEGGPEQGEEVREDSEADELLEQQGLTNSEIIQTLEVARHQEQKENPDNPDQAIQDAADNYLKTRVERSPELVDRLTQQLNKNNLKAPDPWALESQTQAALLDVKNATADPASARGEIFGQTSAEAADSTPLSTTEIATVLGNIRDSLKTSDSNYEARRAGLDIAIGMVRNWQEDPDHREGGEQEKPDPEELSEYLKTSRQEAKEKFTELVEARADELGEWAEDPVATRTAIDAYLGVDETEEQIAERQRQEEAMAAARKKIEDEDTDADPAEALRRLIDEDRARESDLGDRRSIKFVSDTWVEQCLEHNSKDDDYLDGMKPPDVVYLDEQVDHAFADISAIMKERPMSVGEIANYLEEMQKQNMPDDLDSRDVRNAAYSLASTIVSAWEEENEQQDDPSEADLTAYKNKRKHQSEADFINETQSRIDQLKTSYRRGYQTSKRAAA